jgi:hypothetical protein
VAAAAAAAVVVATAVAVAAAAVVATSRSRFESRLSNIPEGPQVGPSGFFTLGSSEVDWSMPHFHIQGESEAFADAEHVQVEGEMNRHGFVTVERLDETTVLISEVSSADLQSFDGLLFQVDLEDDDEESIVLRQVQMFFWPWDDDEEYEEEDPSDTGSNGSLA